MGDTKRNQEKFARAINMVVTSTAILASLHSPGFFLPAFHKGYHLKHPTAGHSSTHLASIQEAEASESEFWASLVYIVSSKIVRTTK